MLEKRIQTLTNDVEQLKDIIRGQSEYHANVSQSNSQSNQAGFEQLMAIWFPDSIVPQHPVDTQPSGDLRHLSFPYGIQMDQEYAPSSQMLPYPVTSSAAATSTMPPVEQLTDFTLDDWIADMPGNFVQGSSTDGEGYREDGEWGA
jgi:hypothetical protein